MLSYLLKLTQNDNKDMQNDLQRDPKQLQTDAKLCKMTTRDTK